MWITELVKKYNLDYNDLEGFVFRDPRVTAKGVMTSSGFNVQISSPDEITLISNYAVYLEQSNKTDQLNRLSKALSQYQEQNSGNQSIQQQLDEKRRHIQNKQDALTKMLISSGFSFEGYRITKYSGYISGDDAVEIPRGGIFGNNNGQNLTNALVKIRIQALKELKEAAYELGCNAVIGVDFDYLTLEPESSALGRTIYEPYVICVTANGNAVVVEKVE